MSGRWRNVDGRLVLKLKQSCSSATSSRTLSQINAFIFQSCPHSTAVCVCVCVRLGVSAHTLTLRLCVFRRASGPHRGFCASCVGHVEEDVSRGQVPAAAGEGGSPAAGAKVQSDPRSCSGSGRERVSFGREARNKEQRKPVCIYLIR